MGGIVVQHRSGTKSKLHSKIEEFRAAGYPVTLKELDESYSIPDGDGKELRYKKLDSGFVVYSVDEDLIDDGGREEPKDRRQKVPHWDITFTIKNKWNLK